MRQGTRPGQTSELIERLARAPDGARHELLVEFVRNAVAAVLAEDRSKSIPLELGLFEMGMDSLMSVELKRRLELGVGRSLPSTLTFNYPNVGALAAFLEHEIGPAHTAKSPLNSAPPAPRTANRRPGPTH